MAEVDTSSRQGARKHHTATHLLQSALKQVLREEGEISQQVLLVPLSNTQGVDAYAGDCGARLRAGHQTQAHQLWMKLQLQHLTFSLKTLLLVLGLGLIRACGALFAVNSCRMILLYLSCLWMQGSLVTADRLRFDFNLHRGLKEAEVARVEELVNGWVTDDTALTTREMPLAEAKAAGVAMSQNIIATLHPSASVVQVPVTA